MIIQEPHPTQKHVQLDREVDRRIDEDDRVVTQRFILPCEARRTASGGGAHRGFDDARACIVVGGTQPIPLAGTSLS